MSTNKAFDTLVNIASKTKANALPIPAEGDDSPRRSGIGFSLLGKRFIAPMGQVSEMLEIPSSTRLPGVQPWVMGLSNVRGRLLPLFDMTVFFGSVTVGQKRQRRALVIDSQALYCGLVVDQAYGMQHFTRDLYREQASDIPDTVQPFVKGEYVDATGVPWAVFDMAEVVKYPRFLNAAAS